MHQSKARILLPIGPQYSNLGPILSRFRDILTFVHRKPLFLAPLPYSAQNFTVFPLEYTRDVGSAKSEHPKLTNSNAEIILEEFQPM